MQQCGSCPRGPFCAFAHIESKWLQYGSNPFIVAHSHCNTDDCTLTKHYMLLSFLYSYQSPLFQRNLLSPHQAPLHLPDPQNHSLHQKTLQVQANTAWGLYLHLDVHQTFSQYQEAPVRRSRGCWEVFSLFVSMPVEEQNPHHLGWEREDTAGHLASRGRIR